jgi:DNA segregation ATPase FtsK/SpoIIIE-like protein
MTALWATLPRPVAEPLAEVLEARPQVEERDRPVDLARAAEIEREVFAPLWLGRGFYCGKNGTKGYVGDELDVWMNLPGEGGRHALIAGASGAGKTNCMHTLVRQVARRERVAIVVIDPKEVDFTGWVRQLAMLALGDGPARTAFGYVVEEFRYRKALVSEYNRMAVERGLVALTSLPLGVPILGDQFDYILVIVDEVESLTDPDNEGHQGRKKFLKDLLRLGRAFGIGVLLATQQPNHNVVPTGIRNLCRTRVCFGTESRDQSNVIWGEGYNALTVGGGEVRPPHAIEQIGEAFVRWDRDVWHFQAAYTSPQQIQADAATLPRTPGPASWPHVIEDDAADTCPHCGR